MEGSYRHIEICQYHKANYTVRMASRVEQARQEGGRSDTSTKTVELDDATRDFLKALASEGRQEVMMLFAGGAELSVSEVAERAGIGQSTASQQLALLRRGRILASRREGKTVYYRSDNAGTAEVLANLQSYLASCC
jgi:DNA-binding transcriptional ArsR family regulator